MNGIIETSSGNLLRAGYCTFTPGDGESYRTDVPEPAYVYWQFCTQYHRWTGATWVIEPHTPPTYGPTDIEYYTHLMAVVNDAPTGVQGPFLEMQVNVHRRELFNDEENPVYLEGHTPILGANGWGQDHADRINNLENIHSQIGWHEMEVRRALYARPKDMLIYYGWPSGFNAYWQNELVARDMARYGLVVFGSGLEETTHGDHANTVAIAARVKQLNPSCRIFGYVDTTLSESNFQDKAGKWKNNIGVHGIFMDKYGYDWGNTRAQQNVKVDYVHNQGLVAFVNCWNMNHALGTANDPSYPNSTYNVGETASSLGVTDWYLMESFAVNTDAYTGSNGFETKSQWTARLSTMISLRATYGIQVAGGGIILDSQANGQAMFEFAETAALMASLDAYGVSDTSYGSSSGKGKWWTRPDLAGIGKVYTHSPSIFEDPGDSDVYMSQCEFARFMIDFSAAAQTSSITKWWTA